MAALDTNVPVTVALELEWLLRSRLGLAKPAVLQVVSQLLSTVELRFNAATALEWALRHCRAAATDFSDGLHAALAFQAGALPFWTFDKAAAKPGRKPAAIMPAMPAKPSSPATRSRWRWRQPFFLNA